MNSHAATIPSRPTGTFTRKISRHPPAASSSPPTAGPRAKTERLGGALDADGPAERTRRDGQVDDGHAVGLQHRRPDGLQGPGPVQYHEVRRQAAEGRADDEDAEAVGVDELAPDHVGQAAHGGDRGHEHQQVAEADPGHRGQAGVKGLLQAGQGQGDDAGVKLAHEGAGAHRGHDEPMSVPVLRHRGAGGARRAAVAASGRSPRPRACASDVPSSEVRCVSPMSPSSGLGY